MFLNNFSVALSHVGASVIALWRRGPMDMFQSRELYGRSHRWRTREWIYRRRFKVFVGQYV